MDQALAAFAQVSIDNQTVNQNDYVDEDGFLHCGTCKQAKEMLLSNTNTKVPILCACEIAERDQKEKDKQKERIEKNRKLAFSSQKSKRLTFTFESDDGRTPEVTKKTRIYCQNFKSYKQNGSGLLLYSDTSGGGKTFFSCAIANELVNQGYKVRVTDFITMRDEMFYCENKVNYIMDLRSYDLLVIDDFGSENGTEHMRETEYRIIDDLTENCVPMILTTNYTLSEMQSVKDIERRRIFDRVLGSCVPIQVDPPGKKSRRIESCQQLIEDFKAIMQESNAEKES